MLKIRATIPLEQFKALIELLSNFKELFDWTPSKILGIATSVITYETILTDWSNLSPKVKKKKATFDEKKLIIRVEVGKLVNEKFVKEIRFQTLVASLVLVMKLSRKWRMCINSRDLKKACWIRTHCCAWTVSSYHKLLIFMCINSGYNHIKIFDKDAPYTTFYLKTDLYRYNVIPFEFINVVPSTKVWSISCSWRSFGTSW